MKLNYLPLGVGYVYADAEAMYANPDGTLQDSQNNVAWIARDVNKNKLFVPWGPQPYNQYVADPTNSAWRWRILRYLLEQFEKGFTVVELDDVNLMLAKAATAAPADPNTNHPVTPYQWADMVLSYVGWLHDRIKERYPNVQIIHNSPWFASLVDGTPQGTDPRVLQQWKCCDIVEIERGFSDVNGGNVEAYWTLAAKLVYCDRIHAAGKSVFVYEYEGTPVEYSVACAWLMTNGSDYIEFRNLTPDANTAALLACDLGSATLPRYRFRSGLWERPFANGHVLVNEPGAPTITVPLGSSMTDVFTGQVVTSVTLKSKEGVVLHA